MRIPQPLANFGAGARKRREGRPTAFCSAHGDIPIRANPRLRSDSRRALLTRSRLRCRAPGGSMDVADGACRLFKARLRTACEPAATWSFRGAAHRQFLARMEPSRRQSQPWPRTFIAQEPRTPVNVSCPLHPVATGDNDGQPILADYCRWKFQVAAFPSPREAIGASNSAHDRFGQGFRP
jgi:hypothetical protein